MRRLLSSLLAACLALVVATAVHAQARPSTAGPGVQVLSPPFAMPGLDRERTVRLYLPPSYAGSPERRYPVIYLHDGQNLFDDATAFAGEWGVDETMDELARTRGFEAIVVGIDNGGEARTRELSPWTNEKYGEAQGEAYMAFVAQTLKPWIDAHYRTQPGRESTAIGGSSMGGLITHYALLHWPQVFGKGIVFSPSYWFSDQVYAETRAHPWPAGTRVYFYIGGHEGEESVPDVRRMMALLTALPHGAGDYQLSINAFGEHNERAWRAEFPRAVAWLFALPNP